MSVAAVFLDRDGVLIEERLSVDADIRSAVRALPGVAAALATLAAAGFLRIVVTNQPIVARGLASEDDVVAIHHALERVLMQAGAPPMTSWRFCPHHPHANVAAYRKDCRCRKPRPGMLEDTAAAYNIDPMRSFLVGDRMTDIEAGARFGCRTVLIDGPARCAPRIETPALPLDVVADAVVPDLEAAAAFIVASR